MSANLLSYRGSRPVGLAELAALPSPEPLGPMHRPVPHHELVEVLKEELASAGYEVTREEYAIQHHGLKLFGVMDLVPRPGVTSPLSNGDKGLGLGFRHGNDQTLGLRLVAGARLSRALDNLAYAQDRIM